MRIDTVFLPSQLDESLLRDRAVVVLDVLRATTTMTSALSAGVSMIRVFDSTTAASEASANCEPKPLLCGEKDCLPPAGFDLGNSPGDFTAERCADRTVYMSTTNGTRALVASRAAAVLIAGALVNARAVAETLVATKRDVTFVCAGTEGRISMEDVIGAGAIAEAVAAIWSEGEIAESDATQIARATFRATKSDLFAALSRSTGGRNVVRAGLEKDIRFAARLDVFDIVGILDTESLILKAHRPMRH